MFCLFLRVLFCINIFLYLLHLVHSNSLITEGTLVLVRLMWFFFYVLSLLLLVLFIFFINFYPAVFITWCFFFMYLFSLTFYPAVLLFIYLINLHSDSLFSFVGVCMYVCIMSSPFIPSFIFYAHFFHFSLTYSASVLLFTSFLINLYHVSLFSFLVYVCMYYVCVSSPFIHLVMLSLFTFFH